MPKHRPIAIYLPQFHPIPENDEWWGKGFTEWTNVTKAKPLFKGHYQPQLPTDLGFYDLRIPDVMEQQAKMAEENGIKGFCFYHYWFTGKRLLEKPLNLYLENKKINFPFMLCWANENWTRRWDGMEHEILMEQFYSPSDDIEHLEHLMPFFLDERYIRINGKPVFVLYKPFLLPDPTSTALRWRQVAAKHGIELYLCHMVFSYNEINELIDGFDAVIDFEPFGIRHENVFDVINKIKINEQKKIINKIVNKVNKYISPFFKVEKEKKYNLLDYSFYLNNIKTIKNFNLKLFPCVVPGWDNSPRKPNNPSLILTNSAPELFEGWLKKVKDDFTPYSLEENLVFINAWNEWAEGNHLEPDIKFGSQYLEVIKKVFKN